MATVKTSWSWRLLALLVVLLALAVRLYRVEAQSLWYDEGITAGLATRSLATIARNAADDIHPPLYYWLLSWWVGALGDGVFVLRAFSAFAGTVLTAGVLALGRRLMGPARALAAGVLAALSPYLVWYSQEVRMYVLAAAWGIALVWLTLDLLQALVPEASRSRSRSRSRLRGESVPHGLLSWLLYVVVALAALHTHYFAGVSALAVVNVVAAMAVIRLIASGTSHGGMDGGAGRHDDSAESSRGLPKRRAPERGDQFRLSRGARSFAWRWLLVQVIVFVLFVPWLVRAWPTIRDWPALGEPTSAGFLAVESMRTFALGVEVPSRLQAGAGLSVLLVVCGLVIGLRKGRRWGTAVAMAWLLAPVFLMWLQSLVRPAWNPKFLIVAAPGFELLAGAGAVGLGVVTAELISRFGHVRRTHVPHGSTESGRGPAPFGDGERPSRIGVSTAGRSIGVAVSVGLILAAAWPRASTLRANFFDPEFQRDDYQGIVREIASMAGPEDVVVVNAPTQVEMVGYYDRGRHTIVPLPIGRPVDEAATTAELERLGNEYRDAYAVLWATDQSDPGRLVEGWLNENRAKAFDRWYGDVRLALWAKARDDIHSIPRSTDLGLPVLFGDDGEITMVHLVGGPTTVCAGDLVTLEAWWLADDDAPPSEDYVVFVHLLDEVGNIVAQRDMRPRNGQELTSMWAPVDEWAVGVVPEGHVARRWDRDMVLWDEAVDPYADLSKVQILVDGGDWVRDPMALAVPSGVDGGTYRLWMGLFAPATGERLSVWHSSDTSSMEPGADRLDLGPVTVSECGDGSTPSD